MKRYRLFPIFTLACGCAAFLLRLSQFRNGFEAGTGLPIPGNLSGTLLIVLLAAVVVFLLASVRILPDDRKTPPTFPDAFAVLNAAALTPVVIGVFFLALSGGLDILSGFGAGAAAASGSQRECLLVGAMSVISAACYVPAILIFRKKEADAELSWNGKLFLLPVVCLVIRLVLVYRQESVNPALAAYYTELLSLVLLTLALYRLSSFAFQVGQTRRFVLYAVPAVILCAAVLAEGHSLSMTLFYAGYAILLVGLLSQRMWVLSHPWEQA